MDERRRLQIIEDSHNVRRCLVCQNIPEPHRAEINYCCVCGRPLDGNSGPTYDEMRDAYEQVLTNFEEDEMDEIDFGYQVVLSCDPCTRIEMVSWLADQIGYRFPTGEHIEGVEHFQILQLDDGRYSCVAIARVVRTRMWQTEREA